jgi:hypothetical protein
MLNDDISNIFTNKIEKTGDCWIWRGLVGRTGSPIIVYNGREYSVRMYSLLLSGKDASNTKPKPICGNKLCVSPDHLLFGEIERFWSKVRKIEGGCWEWIGGKNDEGYGKFNLNRNGGTVNAHRYSYQLNIGPIPKGMLVCHHCDNPSCVNPKHLFLGTAEDNAWDKENKNRGNHPAGSQCHLSKLAEKDITIIRNDIPMEEIIRKVNEFANHYNVATSTIYDILLRKTWKHLI